MSFYFRPASQLDLLRVNHITSANIQQNKVTESSDSIASSRSRWGRAVSKNTAAQDAPNAQIGTSFNNIRIRSRAVIRDIAVNNIDATNAQSNDVFQGNKQKSFASGGNGGVAKNTSWQTAGNYQVGSAYNSIDISR